MSLHTSGLLPDYLQSHTIMHEMTSEQYRSRQRNTRNARKGKAGEVAAEYALEQLGFKMIEKIGTPIIILGKPKRSGKALSGRFLFGEKVSGDRRAIEPGTGRSVLIEVKTCADKLQFSKLRDGQPEALTKHAELGGLSLLVWVEESEHAVYVMEWPIDGFRSGTSLKPAHARQIALRPIL